jgi:hypothetical protein
MKKMEDENCGTELKAKIIPNKSCSVVKSIKRTPDKSRNIENQLTSDIIVSKRLQNEWHVRDRLDYHRGTASRVKEKCQNEGYVPP